MPELNDKTTRRIVVVLCALIFSILLALAVIIGGQIQGAETTATRRAEQVALHSEAVAERVAIHKVAVASRNQVAGGCERSNITKAIYNRQAVALYTFLKVQAEAVAAASPNPQIRKLAARDAHLAAAQVWQPLTDCALAVGEGVHYRSPPPVYFTRRMPSRAALALPSTGA